MVSSAKYCSTAESEVTLSFQSRMFHAGNNHDNNHAAVFRDEESALKQKQVLIS